MDAALNGCRETVAVLLELGADPNLLSANGDPPLYGALQAGDPVIISSLTEITNIFHKGLVGCLQMLARSSVDILYQHQSGEMKIKKFIERLTIYI